MVGFIRSSSEIILSPLFTLSSGDSGTFIIFYQGTPRYGLFRSYNFAGDTVIYSHNEPYDARFWFPCKDDPSDKATLLMSVSMPSTYIVVSNGRLKGNYPDGVNGMRTVWEENYPIATYLVSLAAAPYRIVEQNWYFDATVMPVRYYVYAPDVGRGENAVSATISMLSFFSEYIGRYPFSGDKYAMAEVPLAGAAAMENQTATTMRDVYMDDAEVIAHELAHQWWGDALTPVSFADIWLNEGFASYFDALYTEFNAGESAFRQRLEDYKSSIFQDGSLAYPVYDPPVEYLFGRSVYFKGAWILHMLRLKLGDEMFRNICRNYYQQYLYKNVTTADFVYMSEQISQIPLQEFFDQWLNYGGIPDLSLNWHQNQQMVKFTIQQLQPEIVYDLSLEIIVQGFARDSLITVTCNSPLGEYHLSFPGPVQTMILDPNRKVLQTNNTPAYYLPGNSSLIVIYPNPLQHKALILYQTDRIQNLRIEIWNILGEKVITLKNEKLPGGLYNYNWEGIDLPSGTYFCVLHAGSHISVKKIVILR
jgi:aminopeptidase N